MNLVDINNILQNYCIPNKITIKEYLLNKFIENNIDLIQTHNIFIIHNNRIVNNPFIELSASLTNEFYDKFIKLTKKSNRLYNLYEIIFNNLFLLIFTKTKLANLISIVTITFEDDNENKNCFINNNKYLGNIHFYNHYGNYLAKFTSKR